MVSGEGARNAYLEGPIQGPDGDFHLCWVWRDSPDASTNHDLCYARSRDLIHWTTSAGVPLESPITFSTAEIVDPVPTRQGLMNGDTRIGFDPAGNVVLSYCKLDPNGSTQIYNARREEGRWAIHQVTDWDGAWLPEGFGTVLPELSVHPVTVDSEGRLTQRHWRRRHGAGKWQLDPEKLTPAGHLPVSSAKIKTLETAERPGMQVNWTRDSGETVAPFALRWESFPENRDRPQEDQAPPPSPLQIIQLEPEDRDRWSGSRTVWKSRSK